MNCPNCTVAMTTMTLDAHLSKPIEIDLCSACQCFWFDKYESLKLSPASVIQLMKLIGENKGAGPATVSNALQCPRCSAHLQLTNDLQRSTRFSYWRCTNDHGKFMRFFDFLKEKNFIRPMSPEQINELRQNVQTMNCTNCGAPIDLATSSSCTHCGSALSMLDMGQAQQTLGQLQQAAQPRPVDPALPFELELARKGVERSFGTLDTGGDSWLTGASTDVVQDVFNAVSKWLTRSH